MIPEPNLLTPPTCNAAPIGDVIAVDFETFYSAKYSVGDLGLWAYVHDPRFRAYLVAVTDGTHTCVCPPAEFPWASLAGRTWVSHHRDFDQSVFHRLQSLSVIPAGIAPAT